MKLPNGFGSVYKLPGNRRKPWAVRITVNRNPWKYKYLGYYETQEDALIALTKYNENPYDLDSVNITFAEVYDKFTDQHFKKVSASNIAGIKASYKLCSMLYNVKFKDIKLHQLQYVVDHCGKNYPTLRKLKILFNHLYKYAIQNDICGKDYSQYVDIAQYKDKNPNKIDRIPFSADEVKVLWDAVDQDEYVGMVLIMIYSGLRVGELRELEKINVHLDEKYIDIVKSKTPSGLRHVPIADKIMPFVQYWMDKNDSKFLITNKNGNQMTDKNFRDAYWNPLMNDLNLDPNHRPHDTRHTCVSMLTKAGVDERIIKRIVGHSGNGITQKVYTHFDHQQLLDAINMI